MSESRNQNAPQDALAAQTSVHEQLQKVRRNRVSGDVIISTAAEYRSALVEAFYNGVKHGRFAGTREMAKKLSREEDARRQYQQDIYELRNENEQLKHRLRIAGAMDADVQRGSEG